MVRHAIRWSGVRLSLLAVALCCGQASGQWTAKSEPDLKQRIESAPELKVEEVCTPVKTVRRGELMRVPNPDGKTYDWLQWYFKGYSGPTTVFIIDLATGKIKKDGIPDRRQIHICGKCIGPNGKLYIATPDWKKGMEIYVYDPASNELSCLGMKVPGLKGEKRCMALGTDGKIYGTGSYQDVKKAGIYQIDPATDEVTVYGPVGPAQDPETRAVWGDGIGADDRYVYVVSGRVPYYLVAYDRETKEERVLLTTERAGGLMRIVQRRHGCWAYGQKIVGTKGERTDYWLHEGKAVRKKDRKEAPPWTIPKDSKPWYVKPPRPQVFAEKSVPTSEGQAEIWYRTAEARAAAPKDPPADAKPEDLGWQAIRFTAPTYPLPIHRVVEMPDGRIFGTAGPYEGNFIYDSEANKSVHLGKIPLSHYCTAFFRGKIYMSGYPNSPLYIYDPTKPWIFGKQEVGQKVLRRNDPSNNPWSPLYLSKVAGTVKSYAAVAGADGRVYFGGRWYRSGNGGGFAWWDVEKQEAGGMWEIFSNYQIDYMTTAKEGQYIVIGSLPALDAVLRKPLPKRGKLFVFDTTQHKLIREIEPIESAANANVAKRVGVGWPGPILGVGGTRVLGMTCDPEDADTTILYGVDVETGEVAFRKKIPYRFPVRMESNQKEHFDYRIGPDKKVWTFIGKALVRIDPSDVSVDVIGKVKQVGRLAFSGRDIYLSGSTALRRIRR